MATKIIIGAQWGDEGKAKIIDILSQEADVVVRTQGGNNAGHTVTTNDKVYKFQLIPSGILYKGTKCVVANGVVIDPEGILKEMDDLVAQGIDISHLKISDRAHLVMPYHKGLDGAKEKLKAKEGKEIGTTLKGIGPCYMDKAERSGIRVCDLFHEATFVAKVKENVKIKNALLKYVYDCDSVYNADTIIETYMGYKKRLEPFVEDTTVSVYRAIKEGKNVLFEGAQGTLLDLDLGTYPYVTSSHPITGGACIGAGIGPTMIDTCIGVMKGYITRVGKGPFPTELFDEIGENIRSAGHEYGTVTGRPRRCGWFDAVIGEYAVRTSGLTEIALNKIDVLKGLPVIKICVAYQLNGKKIDYFPASLEDLEKCEPIYEEMEGWGDISQITTYEALPDSVKKYIHRIEELIGCKITMIGVGPNREQNIMI